MVVQVGPSPRLDVVRECHKSSIGITEAGSSVDDGLSRETINDAAVDIEIPSSCLAFDVTPEDLFLLNSQSMEALLPGEQETVIVIFPNSNTDAAGDGDRDAQQQSHTKIRLTFIPVFKKSQFVNDGIGREKNNRRNDTEPKAVFERLLKKCKKRSYDTINHEWSRSEVTFRPAGSVGAAAVGVVVSRNPILGPFYRATMGFCRQIQPSPSRATSVRTIRSENLDAMGYDQSWPP